MDAFLGELPEIRSKGLAFNVGKTGPEVIAVATPLYDDHDVFVAAVCATDRKENLHELAGLGKRLKDSVAKWILR